MASTVGSILVALDQTIVGTAMLRIPRRGRHVRLASRVHEAALRTTRSGSEEGCRGGARSLVVREARSVGGRKVVAR